MNPDLEEYYGSLKEMFLSSGWKHLIKEVEDDINRLDTLNGVQDEKTLFFLKGQLHVLQNFLNLEESIRLAEQDVSDEGV
jgi:hypothetical protein